jgi:hypothetical protein
VGRWFASFAIRYACAIVLVAIVPVCVRAEWSDNGRDHGHRPPVYQRHAFDWQHGHDKRRGDRRHQGHFWQSPQVNAGWFQRPYPYHLDYYRMRYGGSYAPYFGNLYGPPQVVTAPPYYGPYFGDFGQGYPNGFNNGALGYPPAANGMVPNGAMQEPDGDNQTVTQPAGDELPTPTQ